MQNPDTVQQQALGGFLRGWQARDGAAVGVALDALVACPALVHLVAWLHWWIEPDSATCERLRQAIRSEGAQARGFDWLASARSISASDVVGVLGELMQIRGGMRAALEVLGSRLTPGMADDPDQEPLLALGRRMLCDASAIPSFRIRNLRHKHVGD